MRPPHRFPGAGRAGLVAAITIAGHGGRAVVHERCGDVGMRFHGDFQGLESWAGEGDVLDELQSIGIEPTFEHTPIREMTIFDPAGSAHQYRSPHPIFYLIRRGPYPGTLDASLKDQALACGAEIRFRDRLDALPAGGIAAHGPCHPDAIAVGYVFDTDMADGVVAAAQHLAAASGIGWAIDPDRVPVHPAAEVVEEALVSGEEYGLLVALPAGEGTGLAEPFQARFGLPLTRVQHHVAHVAACMAENGLSGTELGVAWDGSGYGPDGTARSREFLLPEYAAARLVEHSRTVQLHGRKR